MDHVAALSRSTPTLRSRNETIDVSVCKRWRADTAYRPANLVEWAKRKGVDPAQLQTSVKAENPQVSVPDQ